MNLANIPTEFSTRRQWCLWKTISRGGRPTKVPFQVSGEEAKSNDPMTWASLDDVRAAYERGGYNGIGYVFSYYDPYCGIDLDGCRDTESGLLEKWAKDWVLKFNSYAEVSPSGTGVKIYVKAKSPFSTGKKKDLDGVKIIAGKKPAVEMYDVGRYFAITGQRLRGMPLEPQERQAVLQEFISAYWTPERPASVGTPFIATTDVTRRAEKYLGTLPEAISGSSGHNKAFQAACVLVLGFGLSCDEAYPLFCKYNERCVPPWSEREIWHKLRQADKQPGERNYLRDARQESWPSVAVPSYVPPKTEAENEPEESHVLPTLQDAALDYVAKIAGDANPMIELGLPDVDYSLGGGVERGEMVLIAGRPSHGKSCLMLQAMDFLAANNRPCIMISEEMSKLALGKRAVQFISSTPQEHWRANASNLNAQITQHYSNHSPIYIVESAGTAANAVRLIEQAIDNHGVEVAAVDYAQILESQGRTETEKVAATSKMFRRLASTRGIVILLLCQLSREIEKRDQYIPKLSDLRQSGQLEQDADVVMFAVWPHRLDSKFPAHEYKIFIAKNRNRGINEPVISCKILPSRQMLVDTPVEDSPNYVRDFCGWNEPDKEPKWSN